MGAFKSWIEDTGMQLAGGAAGGALGMVLGRWNDKYQDKRQLEQQSKLQAMQEAGQIRVGQAMGDYNLKNAKDMWEYTGYGGQMRQIKDAGLNPALLYGMKGGGGITTGPTASAGNVGSDTTQPTQSNANGNMGMAMQIGLMRAQKENIEADTANKLSENPNIPKTGENIAANTALTNTRTEIAKLEKEIIGATKEEAIMRITAEMADAQQKVMQQEVTTEIARATRDKTIDEIRLGYTTALLNNKHVKSSIGLQAAQVNKMANDIVQGFKQLDINQQNADTAENKYKLDKWINDVQESTKLTAETISGLIKGFLGGRGGKGGKR